MSSLCCADGMCEYLDLCACEPTSGMETFDASYTSYADTRY